MTGMGVFESRVSMLLAVPVARIGKSGWDFFLTITTP